MVKDEKRELSEERRGTPEEIAAAEKAFRDAQASGASVNERRRLALTWGRLKRYRVRRPVAPPLRLVAGGVFSGQDLEALRAKITEQYGPYVDQIIRDMQPGVIFPGMTPRESQLIREKAKDRYQRLLEMFAGKEIDRQPKKRSDPRKVVVRGWPAEGTKA